MVGAPGFRKRLLPVACGSGSPLFDFLKIDVVSFARWPGGTLGLLRLLRPGIGLAVSLGLLLLHGILHISELLTYVLSGAGNGHQESKYEPVQEVENNP